MKSNQGSLKKNLLTKEIEHIDITEIDSRELIKSYSKMSFSAREIANAAKITDMMIKDPNGLVFLVIAGSTSAAGCMQVYVEMIKNNMIDAVVATGATVVDMDFFEALGFKHYKGSQFVDDKELRELYIDRIYDTFIDEEDLQICDEAIYKIAEELGRGIVSSREFINKMGKWLSEGNAKKTDSLVQAAYENNVPIFCPAFSDSSAGFGLVRHQKERIAKGQSYVSIDSVADFRELTEIKMKHEGDSGLFMVGGGTPKNFIQDTVVCAEILGKEVPMHKYAVQITVADVRDGACSSSTLKEAQSWGKVDTTYEQMVYAEATTVVPLIGSFVYHNKNWKGRKRKELNRLFEK